MSMRMSLALFKTFLDLLDERAGRKLQTMHFFAKMVAVTSTWINAYSIHIQGILYASYSYALS